jgi:N-hydroxyarylamine O-acetyltransferase
MVTAVTVDAYLERIGWAGPRATNCDTLRGVHLAHLRTVPFENLDIQLKRPIVLDEEKLLDKVVRRRRGGFCYELNGTFAWLLRSLGFQVTLLSARVAKRAGGHGPPFDHLALRVDLEQPYLADVGFGDSFAVPPPLREGTWAEGATEYRLTLNEQTWRLAQRQRDGSWAEQYVFEDVPRALEEFAPMCSYHQSSTESFFTRGPVCSLSTPRGRISLSGTKLLVTEDGQRREVALESPEAIKRALLESFGVHTDAT